MDRRLDTLLDWIDIESITGNETQYADAIGRELEGLGLGVEKQVLEGSRYNVLARGADPRVVFCTHLDTVPPWIAPTRKGTTIYGRGSCDAKGPALAMLHAARALVDSGEDRIGFLLTVGEETDGAGAQLADRERKAPWNPAYTVVGEPTDNLFIKGGKGIYKCVLKGHGVAGHSSQPIGPSAVHELVKSIASMLGDTWGSHDVFGEGTINFGTIDGGLAANVTAPAAEALVLIRAVEEPEIVEARMRSHLNENTELIPDKSYGPVEFALPDGVDGPVVAFGTDAPFLKSWGTPLLYGPGSIKDAHTKDEKLTEASFDQAIADYEKVVRELLARTDA